MGFVTKAFSRLFTPACLFIILMSQQAFSYQQRVDMSVRSTHYVHDSPSIFGNEMYDDSISAEIRYWAIHRKGQWSGLVDIFSRYDEQDNEKRFSKINDMQLQYGQNNWQTSFGIGTFNWGLAESVSLVDIANQRDFREQMNGRSKIGHSFFQLRAFGEFAELQLFYFPQFDEAEFPNRPNFGKANQVLSSIEHENKERTFVIRSILPFDSIDITLGYFNGHRQQADYSIDATLQQLRADYPFMQAFMIHGIYPRDGISYKFEVLTGESEDEGFFSALLGLEWMIPLSPAWLQDTTFIVEYLMDDRKNEAPLIVQNDIALGMKVVGGWNEAHAARALLIADLDHTAYYLEFNYTYELNDFWSASVDTYHFVKVSPENQSLHVLRNDDAVVMSLSYTF